MFSEIALGVRKLSECLVDQKKIKNLEAGWKDMS